MWLNLPDLDEPSVLAAPAARSAVLSECGTYRYTLTREVGPGLGVLWVMLNPSTADAFADDPTIRRVLGFSKGWGYGVVTVVNLFALRSTDPKALRKHTDPVGPDNDYTIRSEAAHHSTVVCAWGAHGTCMDRDRAVLDMLRVADQEPMCLGVTKDKNPKHPLYLPASTVLQSYHGRD